MTIKKYNLLILILISILSSLLLSISIAADSAVEKKADIENTVIEGTVEKLPGKIQPAWMKISVSGEFGPISDEIQDLAIGPSGSLWVATNRGLSRLSGGKFRHFTRKNGMPHDQVFTVISGKRGVFAGTKGGLVWFDDLAPSKEILPEIIKGTKGAVTSIFECENGFIFLISPQYENSRIGILTLNRDKRPPEMLPKISETNTRIRRLLPAGRNQFYCQVQGRQWIQVELTENSGNLLDVTVGNISDLPIVDVVGIGNEKLILTEDKLLRQTDSQSPQSLPVPGSEDNTDGFLALNYDGTGIWFGKKNNLWLLNSLTGEKLRYFKLPRSVATKSIAEEPNGRLWVGTENNGLFMSGLDNWNIAYIPSNKLEILSQAFESMDQKYLPLILVNFINERQVLVSEARHRLILYEKDNLNTYITWQLKNENLLDILGGEPSFIATEKNIYKLYDNKLVKFIDKGNLLDESDESPVITKEEALRSIKEMSIRFRMFNAIKNVGLDIDEIPVMEKFISKPLLANYDEKELVTLFSDKSGGLLLYSKRFNNREDILISNHLTHTPKTNDSFLVTPVSKTGIHLFFKNNNEILQIDKNLLMERISVLKTVSNEFSDMMIFHEPSDNTNSIFFLEKKGLWQKKNDDVWKQKLFAFDKDTFTLEIDRNLKEKYIPADLISMAAFGTSEFIILAGKETPFDLYHVQFNENTNSSKVNLLNLKTKQWKQNIKISDSQLLLLNQDNTISLLKLGDNPKLQDVDLKEKIYQLNEKSKKIYLLGNHHIWIYKPDENKPKILLPLPSTEKAGPPQEMNFSIDIHGIWLSTKQNGLWRYDKKWIPFYETDGLPSKRIEAVASLNDKEALVITQAGPCKAKKDTAGYWQFFPPENSPGISGKEVRKASLFQLDNALTLALATDKGITLVRWPEDDWDKKKFSHIDQNSVLLDNNVTALHWHEPEKELWAGSGGGVMALKLATDSDGSAKVKKTTLTLTANHGLPRGEVTEITTSSSKDGNKTAWILTKNAITRWYKDNEKDRLVNTEPFFLAHAQDAKLGSSVDGQPPQLLIQDKDYNWSVWNPGTSIYPRLSVKESLFFWYHAQLKIDSLDPALEDLKQWNVEYRIDGTDQPPLIRPWGLLLDIRTDTGPHYILATVKSRNNPSIQYRTSFPIPRAGSQYRIIRLITLFTVIIFIAVSLFWYARKLRIRAIRLRSQEIPYIQGPAIKDPSQFFGREELLKKLRNTIITTNYALVGEFRIGKTSIQFQLNDLLKSFENSKYTFLPVFLDLHLVDPPKEKHFFHFLGEHLINLAQEQNIPPDILSEFHFRQTQSSEKYTSMHFKNDLECLLDWLQEKFPDRPPVIVFQIDEIPLITDFVTLGKLRAILVRVPRFRAVLSGKNIPKDTELDLVSPWWNIFTEIEVEPLTPSEARKLITEPVQGLFQFDEKAIDHIIGRAQGKPLSIQTMCANLLHYKYNTGKFTTRITEKYLYASIDFSSEKRRSEK
ncbi:MAG: hypothetical protein GY749_47775 [Desulfobacteraceae bacterium]|nr:hypothetical protein [Desulfobacteraceae bacterium]